MYIVTYKCYDGFSSNGRGTIHVHCNSLIETVGYAAREEFTVYNCTVVPKEEVNEAVEKYRRNKKLLEQKKEIKLRDELIRKYPLGDSHASDAVEED